VLTRRTLVAVHFSSVVDCGADIRIGSRAWLRLRCWGIKTIVQFKDELALFHVSVSIFVSRGVSWEGEVMVYEPSLVIEGLEVVCPEHVEPTVAFIVFPYLDPVVFRVSWQLAFIKILRVPFGCLEGHDDVLGLPLILDELISLFSSNHFVIDLELDVVRCPFDFIFMPISIRVELKMLEVFLHVTVHYLGAGSVCWVYLHFDHVEVCHLIFPIITSEESQEVV